MGGRSPGRLEGRWAQGRLEWRRRLWVKWEESARRTKSRVMGHGAVSGLSVRKFDLLEFPPETGGKKLILTLNP